MGGPWPVGGEMTGNQCTRLGGCVLIQLSKQKRKYLEHWVCESRPAYSQDSEGLGALSDLSLLNKIFFSKDF